ncbi:putative Ig domain-containing protein [Methanolobus sp. ZRKC5]|uniref:putative Ig domain-containing protein n=1 Tax=unclassified Methanolobus TaxID=2629569 RepID=UPI00313D9040
MNRTTTIFISIIIILLSALVVSASDENLIFLKSGNIDTDRPPEKNVSEQDQAKVSSTFELEDSSETYYIVQFEGPVSQQWKDEVQNVGAEFFDYIPNNAFVLRMNGTEKILVESLDFVRWTGEFLPEYKYTDENLIIQDTNLLADDVNASEMILFIFDPIESYDIESNVETLGGIVVDASDRILRIQIPSDNLEDLASISGICWIDKYEETSVSNDVAASIVKVNAIHNTLKLNGSDQIIAVCDTGLDTGVNDNSMHADIRGRILSITDFSGDGAQDITGHGTHVTGSVLGNGEMSDGQYAGMAPEASLIFQAVGTDDWELGGIPTSNISILFQNAYDAGARIHTNSWGADSNGAYNSYSYSVDQFSWSHPDMLILFSAGNEGSDLDYDSVVDSDSLNTPATAKNCIAVGASENDRGDNFGTAYKKWGDIDWSGGRFLINPIKDDYTANNPEGIAAFSSRGPTDDGRIKPDIVAPGTFIASTKSSQASWYDWGIVTENTNYAYLGGSSMSTPIVAGSAALVREYYTEIENMANPSAALMKATLLNGAYDMAPGQYDDEDTQEIDSRPDYSQGWGRLDVENSILVPYPEVIAYFDDISLSTSDSWSHIYEYVKSGQPMRATLAWTDYPGTIFSSKELVNDLDMIISGPSGTYYGNNGPDHVNNVEGIELSNTAEGDYTITVVGYSIIQPLDLPQQPFALVLAFTCDNNKFPAQNSYTENSTTVVSTDVVHPAGVDQSSINMSINDIPVVFNYGSIPDGYNIWYNTPVPYQEGEYNVSVTAMTDSGQQFSYGWKFNVEAAQVSNHAPVLEYIGDKVIIESEILHIDISAIDEDDDNLTFATNASFGSLNDNIFTWTPDYNDSGVYYVEFNVTDGIEIDNETITITVENKDRAPELTAIDNKTVDENELLNFTILATDPDGETVAYFATNLPNGANLDPSTGVFSWIPGYDHKGTYNVEFIATANSLNDSETIVITVENVDRAPELATIGNKAVDENELLSFTISATDPDDETVTYSATNLPDGANLDPSTGEFRWTPDYNDENSYDVEFIAESNSLSDSETIVITVENVDREPELAAIGNKAVNENELLSFAISATDPDDETVTYNAINLPDGANLNPSTGEFRWTPDYNDENSYDVEFIAESNSLSDSETIVITVENVDRAPELATISNKAVDENELLSFTISATDPDDETITYSATTLPDGANLDPSTGEFRWIPDYNDEGSYYVQFIAESNSLSDSETIVITVENVDRAPELATISNKAVDENELLSFTISATDPDGETVTYSTTNLPGGANLDPSTGEFTWTPAYGESGNYDVEFIAEANGLDDTETITISVGNVDRAPELATIGNKAVDENELLSFTISATDPDDETVTYSATNLPDGANLDPSTGEFRWTPGYNDSGSYNVNFIATANSLTDLETITITVNNIDRAPNFEPIGNRVVDENELLSFTTSAIDLDDDTIIYSTNTLPAGATFDSITKEFRWTPGYDDSGSYDINFIATANSLTDSETITITVDNIDRAPELDPIGNKVTDENELLIFSISATDPDDDKRTYSAVDLPSEATFDSSTGEFRWTPGHNDSGSYNIEFIVTAKSLNDSEKITITVVNVNSPPSFELVSSKTIEINENLQFTINATDADNEHLDFSNVGTLPDGATFNDSSLLFNWTPIDNQTGTYSVNFTVTDGIDHDNLTVPITVTEVSVATASISTTSGGGGGGGGGGTTGEEFENIELKDVSSLFVGKDNVKFEFRNEDNDIQYIGYKSLKNAGTISVTVEILRDKSTFADSLPSGTIYKNINIWVGKTGYAIDSNIDDPVIGFRVDRKWIENYNIGQDSIVINRYNGVWSRLSTTQTSSDDNYLYFEASVPGFSPFAITGEALASEKSLRDETDALYSTEDNSTYDSNVSKPNENQPENTLYALSTLVSCLIISFVCFLMRKQ